MVNPAQLLSVASLAPALSSTTASDLLVIVIWCATLTRFDHTAARCGHGLCKGEEQLKNERPGYSALVLISDQMLEDGRSTRTSEAQYKVEQEVLQLYESLLRSPPKGRAEALRLRRADHVRYLCSGLQTLPAGYIKLNASRPWICYWIRHSLALLEAPLPKGSTEAGTWLMT